MQSLAGAPGTTLSYHRSGPQHRGRDGHNIWVAVSPPAGFKSKQSRYKTVQPLLHLLRRVESRDIYF
jgi:hypothetical protein